MISRGWERWPERMTRRLRVERVDGSELRTWSDRAPTVGDAVFRTVERLPEKTMLVDPERSVTYAEFAVDASRIAARLREEGGVGPGDRVALLCSNSARFLELVIAVHLCGATVVSLNTKLRARELEFQLADSQPAALLTEAEWWAELASVRDGLAVRQVFVAGGGGGGARPLEELERPGSPPFEASPISPGDAAFICYTSGTTGVPKGALLTHFGCTNNFRNFAEVSLHHEGDRSLVLVPMFHVSGLLAQTLLIASVGGTSVIMPRFDARTALELVARERITHVLAPPAVYITLLTHPERELFDVSSLRILVNGSAPISPETIGALKEWVPGVDVQNAYGLTETSSISTAVPVEEAVRKAATIGLPVPTAACRTVVPGSDRDADEDEPGELLIAGPQVVPGYWARPDATAEAIRDGWLRTGDVAAIDGEGYVRLLDRIKDMINRGGEKVFCVEVEAVLHEHPQVLEAAVVGVPHPVYGEAVKAVVAPRPGAAIDPEELRAFVRSRLARYKVPQEIELVEALPRNPSGKVVKSELRAAGREEPR